MKQLRNIIALLVLVFVVTACGCASKYTVTFDTDGGTEIEEVTVRSGEKVERPEDPTKDGYAFDGWFTEDGVAWDFDDPVENDLTLFARWADESFIVRFDSNGGTSVPNQTVVKNETVEKPANPTRSDYEFLYWSLDEEEFDFDTPITKSITLKAEWEEVGMGLVLGSRPPSGGTTPPAGGGNNPPPKPPVTPPVVPPVPPTPPTAEEQAAAFIDYYQNVLDLSVDGIEGDEVTEDDRADIMAALEAYSKLPQAVKDLLLDKYAHLNALLDHLDGLITAALATEMGEISPTYSVEGGVTGDGIEAALISAVEDDVDTDNFDVSASKIDETDAISTWEVKLTSVHNPTIYDVKEVTVTNTDHA